MCSVYTAKVKQAMKARWRYGQTWEHESRLVYPQYEIPIVKLSKQGEQELCIANWSMLPKWEKREGKPLLSTHNAKFERLFDSPLWGRAWNAGNRCLIPATSFIEHQDTGEKLRKKWEISVGDQDVFCFAGLWRLSKKPDGTFSECCTIITLEAGELMAEIHNTMKRQPAILEESEHDLWLNGSKEQAQALLKRLPDELLIAKPAA